MKPQRLQQTAKILAFLPFFFIAVTSWASDYVAVTLTHAKTREQVERVETVDSELLELEAGCRFQLKTQRVPTLCFEWAKTYRDSRGESLKKEAEHFALWVRLCRRLSARAVDFPVTTENTPPECRSAVGAAWERHSYKTEFSTGPEIERQSDDDVRIATRSIELRDPETVGRGPKFLGLPRRESGFSRAHKATGSHQNTKKY